MSRHGSHSLTQMMGALSQRFNGAVPSLVLGTIVSFDSELHMAVAHVDFGGGFAFDTPLTQLMVPWHGVGFSDASGPVAGQQCVVGILDLAGDVFVILGFTPFDPASGIGVASGEKMTLDPRTSFVHWAAQRGGMIRSFGVAIASVFGGTGTEVGGEMLDPVEDAISTKRYVDAALAAQTAAFNETLATFAATLQGGSGVPPPMLMPVTSNGSSKARAVP